MEKIQLPVPVPVVLCPELRSYSDHLSGTQNLAEKLLETEFYLQQDVIKSMLQLEGLHPKSE